MQIIEHTVQNPEGIHARPAGKLVKEAQRYASAVTLRKGQSTADLKRLFAVMGLAVKQGTPVIVEITGEDEQQAAQELRAFLQENF